MTEQISNETQDNITPESFLSPDLPKTPPTEGILSNLQNTAKYQKNKLNQIKESRENGASEIDKVLKANDKGIKAFEYSDTSREDIFATLSDGSKVAKYETYVHGEDNEELYASKQTAGEKWSNGLTKLGGKFLTGVVGNIVGSAYGLGEAIGTGNFDATFDNSMMDYLDDLNSTMDNKLPNYYSKSEKDMSLMESTGTANFWANDVTGGAVFTLSAIASEAIMATVSGGMSLSTTGARLGSSAAKAFKGVSKTRALAKQLATLNTSTYYNKLASVERAATSIGAGLGKTASAARFMYTTSMYESGFETREFKKEMRTNFDQDFYKMNNRLPDIEERKDFESNLNDAAGLVFGANMAIVGTSNLFGQVANIVGYKGSRVSANAFNSSLFGSGVTVSEKGVYSAIKATSKQKKARIASSLLKGSLPEAAEEGGQSTVSIGASKWVMNKFNPEYKDSVYDIMDGLQEGAYETLTTSQGQKEMFIGALLGLASGSAGSIRRHGTLEGEYAQKDKNNESFASFMNSFSGKNFSQTLMYGQRSSEATEAYDEAIEAKDPIASERARLYSTVAQLNYAYNMEYYDKTVGDSVISMQSIPLKDIMDTYDMTEAEAADFKQKQIESYRNTAYEYKKNRKYADNFLGDKLTEKESELYGGNIESLKEVVAYNLTVGKEAYDESGNYLDQLIDALGTAFTNSSPNIKEAMMVMAAMNDNDASLLEVIPKEIQARTEEAENLREKIRLMPTATDQASKEQYVSELNRLTEIITANEIEIEKLEKQANILMGGAVASKFYSEESASYMTAEDLLSIQEFLDNLTDIEDQNLGVGDTTGNKINNLLHLYSASLSDFKYYSKMVDNMNEWSFEVTGNKNKLNRLKEEYPSITEATQNFLEDAEKRRLEDVTNIELSEANLINSGIVNTVLNKTPNLAVNPVSLLNTKVSSNPNEFIKNRIVKLVEKSPYLKSKGVTVSDELKLVSGNADITEEMKQLLLDGTVDSETKKTIQEYTDIIESIKESPATEINNGIQEKGFDEILTSQDTIYYDPKGVKLSVRDSSAVQVYENAFIRLGKEFATIFNITPSGFLKAINHTGSVDVLLPNGSSVVSTVENLPSYRGVGTEYSITMEDKVITFTDAENGNMTVNNDSISDLKEKGGIDFYNSSLTRTNKYIALYSQGKPLKSDFNDTNEGLTYTPQQAYNLKQGDQVGFVVNKEDSYNKKLLEEYNNSPKKAEDKAKLNNNLKIDIIDSRSNVIGTLKGTQNTSNLDDKFISLRVQAVKDVLGTKESGIININASTTIDHVFLGIPNLTIKDGAIDMQDVDPNDVVDYGYYEKGKLVLKNNTKDVRDDIVKKLKASSSPVVILKQHGVLIAFPVGIKKHNNSYTTSNFIEDFNSAEDKTRFIIDFNKRLKDAGMDPSITKSFFINFDEQNIFSNIGGRFVLENSAPLKLAIDELSIRESSYDYKKEWMSDSFEKENLSEQAIIGVNPKTEFMTSPKPILSLEGITLEKLNIIKKEEESVIEAAAKVQEIKKHKYEIKRLEKQKERLLGKYLFKNTTFFIERGGKQYMVAPHTDTTKKLVTEVSTSTSTTKPKTKVEDAKTVTAEYVEKENSRIDSLLSKERKGVKDKTIELIKIKMSIVSTSSNMINNENSKIAATVIGTKC